MTNIAHVSDMAELAEASYANLIKTNDPGRVLIASGFSTIQAAEFVTNWTLIDHLPDDPDRDFSATLFKSKAGGEYALAFRGTAGIADDLLYADLSDIVLDGLVAGQIVDIYGLSPCCCERRVETNNLGAVA